MESVDLSELIKSSRKVDESINKKRKNDNSSSLKKTPIDVDDVNVRSSTQAEYPYEVMDDDHCESPLEAYADISSFLNELAKELNKTPETLAIYDPYYCEGSMIERLNSLGYKNVYNRKEDFYVMEANNTLPDFDVLVTNPPYSSDNVEKLLRISLKSNKPFFLLMPNYVYTKDYYDRIVLPFKRNIFYVVPKKGRYLYTTPKGRRQAKSSKYTAPFPTFWYCSLVKYQHSVLGRCRQTVTNEATFLIAANVSSIPIESAPDNDPRKKKLRNSQKRAKNQQRKKAKQLITNDNSNHSKNSSS